MKRNLIRIGTSIRNVCAMNVFQPLFVISFFAITKQQELTAINETYVTDIMRTLQDMSKDSGIVLLAQTDPFISNASILLTDEETDDEHDKADTDNVFAQSEDDNINSTEEKSPKMKNILRWLPPKKPKKINYTQKREEQEVIAKEERNALKARQINAERIAYVMALLKGDFWSTVYMYGEVQRIINNREVLDDVRKMIIFLEKDGNEKYKKKVLKCLKDATAFRDYKWNKKPNNLVIQVLKDPENDNVIA